MRRLECLRILLRGPFVRNVATLMSGTAVAQAVTVLSAPLITRLYDPTAFGHYGLVLAIAAPVAIIASLRYELAIVLPARDDEAADLLALSLGLALIVPLLVAFGLVAFGDHVARAVGDDSIRPLLWWVPIIVALTGVFQSASYWYIRRERFNHLAVTTTGKAVATFGVQAAAGVGGGAAMGLVGGHVVGLAAGVVALWVRIVCRDRSQIMGQIRVSSIIAAARTHARFPAYSAPQALVNALSRNAPLLVLGSFFGPALVGHYLLAHRVLKMPITLLGNAFRQVFYPRAVAVARDRALGTLVSRVTLALGIAVFVPGVVLSLWAPAAFAFAFGEAWEQAGVYAQALGVWLMSGLVAAPSVVAVNVLSLQRTHAVIETVSLVARVAALVVGGMIGDDVIAIRAFALVGLLSNALVIFVVLLRCRRADSSTEAA
jgi:lipopolysaccharide exporter